MLGQDDTGAPAERADGSNWRRRLVLGGLALAGVAGVVGAGLARAHHRDLPADELERKYARGDDDFVDVAGIRVHYRDDGPRDAPVLVCLHGTFSSLHTWDGWAAALADEYRVVRPDLPGHGLTGPHPENSYEMAAYVEFLGAFLDELGIEECALAGNSRGGEVAWQFALDHPDRASALVLVDSMGFPLEVDDPLGLLELPVLPALLSRLTPRWLVRRSVRDVYGNPERVPDDLVDRYHDLLRREGNRDASLELVRRDADPVHRHEELANLRVPTLVLWGEEDYWIPPRFAEKFADTIPDAEVVTYEDAGHAPMEEFPERTAADIRRFLAEQPGEGR
ncbi:alpha/beta hydrolase [Halobacteriales archaeon QS_4_70_19]|nr:MAG: alpha/beta hydrolase [Halobacteriales archaeon QS_4_70_19]